MHMKIKLTKNILAAGVAVGLGELTSSADRRLDKAPGTRSLSQLFGS